MDSLQNKQAESYHPLNQERQKSLKKIPQNIERDRRRQKQSYNPEQYPQEYLNERRQQGQRHPRNQQENQYERRQKGRQPRQEREKHEPKRIGQQNQRRQRKDFQNERHINRIRIQPEQLQMLQNQGYAILGHEPDSQQSNQIQFGNEEFSQRGSRRGRGRGHSGRGSSNHEETYERRQHHGRRERGGGRHRGSNRQIFEFLRQSKNIEQKSEEKLGQLNQKLQQLRIPMEGSIEELKQNERGPRKPRMTKEQWAAHQKQKSQLHEQKKIQRQERSKLNQQSRQEKQRERNERKIQNQQNKIHDPKYQNQGLLQIEHNPRNREPRQPRQPRQPREPRQLREQRQPRQHREPRQYKGPRQNRNGQRHQNYSDNHDRRYPQGPETFSNQRNPGQQVCESSKKNEQKKQTNEKEIPEFLLCPISQVIMIDPVLVTVCGHTFESSLIREWVTKNSSCPLCKKAIEDLQKNLMKNFALLDAISHFNK